MSSTSDALVHELELDLDAFEGPFDLLLTLLLREELSLSEIDIAEIVITFCERLAERDRLDLDACGEFLVLVGALLELKARELHPDSDPDVSELDPESAAEELAARLEQYRRIREAAVWLSARLGSQADRHFRLGPPPLAPHVERPLPSHDPVELAAALRVLCREPPQVSLAHMQLHFPPIERFLEQFRSLLRSRRRFVFDTQVGRLARVEQAAAFLALLELRKSGEVTIEQAAPFAPIRVLRPDVERLVPWKTATSA